MQIHILIEDFPFQSREAAINNETKNVYVVS